jgi:prepilin signal peptidase PulO-like enzyme (type II secretory pathway)
MMQACTPLSGSVSNVCGWIFKDRKLAAFVLSLVLFCSSFEAVNAVLPSYIPALRVAYRGRDSLVQQYFDLGLNYVEIISFLLLTHGISLSLRQLKRILRRKGLTRRQNYSDPAEVVAAVGRELRGSGSLIGYRL